jgi:N utilization substance protein B
LGFAQKPKLENKLAGKVSLKLKKIDKLIAAAAPEWRIDKINRIDLAILRLAVWELVVDKKNPPKAIIDEAVELAKKFGGESAPGFVNGVLGTILKIS